MEKITSIARGCPYKDEDILKILEPLSFCIKSSKYFDTDKLPYSVVLKLLHHFRRLNRSYITTPHIIIYPDNYGNVRIIKNNFSNLNNIRKIYIDSGVYIPDFPFTSDEKFLNEDLEAWWRENIVD